MTVLWVMHVKTCETESPLICVTCALPFYLSDLHCIQQRYVTYLKHTDRRSFLFVDYGISSPGLLVMHKWDAEQQ